MGNREDSTGFLRGAVEAGLQAAAYPPRISYGLATYVTQRAIDRAPQIPGAELVAGLGQRMVHKYGHQGAIDNMVRLDRLNALEHINRAVIELACGPKHDEANEEILADTRALYAFVSEHAPETMTELESVTVHESDPPEPIAERMLLKLIDKAERGTL